MMEEKERISFMAIVDASVSGCKKFITEKLRFLEALLQVREDPATQHFAKELHQELELMEEEFRFFTSRVNK